MSVQNMFGSRKGLARMTCLAFMVVCMVACSRERKDIPAESYGKVVFRLSNQAPVTKSMGSAPAAESAVQRWSVLVYEQGALVSVGTSGSEGDIELSLPVGEYQLRAVANYPVSGNDAFVPSSYTSLSSLGECVFAYSVNSLSSFVLYGEGNLSLTASGSDLVELHVGRLMAKVEILSIEAGFDNEMAYERGMELTGIGMSNVYGYAPLVNDYTDSQVSSSLGSWVNAKGEFQDGYAGLLFDDASATFASVGDSHTIAHVFYVYPNPVISSADSRDVDGWSKRCTRVVVTGTIGGTPRYWTLTLPGPIVRNTAYVIDKLILKGNGSLDPESGEEADIEYEMSIIDINLDDDDFIVDENS